MPFPVAKLGYLAIKQIAKPFALAIKGRAKKAPLLRKCISSPAQWYHSFETKVKMRLMGFGRSVTEVKPLNEEMAVELGAEMLGEIVIFTVGAAIIGAEYARQARKEQSKEDSQNDRLTELEAEVAELGLNVAVQNAEISQLNRLIQSLDLEAKVTEDSSGRTEKAIDRIVDTEAGVQLKVQR